MRFVILTLTLIRIWPASAAYPAPRVTYTALSDAARKAGRLARYDKVAVRTGALRLEGCELRYAIPKTARAYDVVPISVRLTQPAGPRVAAVEAVAFEDAKRTRGRALYDMAIPGEMGVKLEYLGSMCADLDPSRYVPLTADPKTPVSPFPPYKRDPMVRSGVIREAQIVWLKFRLTNTGDTILDPEGFGACLLAPEIARIGPDGKEEWRAQPVNQYLRFLNYLYPAESVDLWTDLYSPRFGSKWCRGLREGSYRLELKLLYRFHRRFDRWVNLWGGAEAARLELPLQVTRSGGFEPVSDRFQVTDMDDKMPGYLGAFEEFMTSFRVYQPVERVTQRRDTVYLQVAPWTSHVTIKLVLTNPRRIAVARVPVNVTRETLRIERNPKNVMVVRENGGEEPAIIAMEMPGMRAGFQLGPYPEVHLRQRLREMKSLGVNVIANTSGNWWLPELTDRKEVELHSACYKFFYDVLMREEKMKVLGWSVYPPSSVSWYANAAPLLRRELKYSTIEGGYVGPSAHVDLADPIVPEVIAAWAKYNYARWGDLYFKTKDGRVPIDIEDTWGWMRDDINLRYKLGPLGIQRFRDWVKAKHVTIDAVNRAWASNYTDFDEIDPQADQGIEGDGLTHGPVYNVKANVFHDWSPAVADWDTFRTELRMEIYRKANELIRRAIPGAELALRCEGANLTIPGDPNSGSSHLRHVYYSQRRNAMVQHVVGKADVLHFYSDHTTLPYTEEEWRSAMRGMVARGIIPTFLPQFDHMRDILLNDHYGRDYRLHYGLDAPRRGMMIHCLMAAYPWWKATYEEGGAPGIIWSDYLCDGFATETQKREIKLLREQFRKMR